MLFASISTKQIIYQISSNKSLSDILFVSPYLKKFFRARPELVEEYPPALEDILQQVQDERGKKSKILDSFEFSDKL